MPHSRYRGHAKYLSNNAATHLLGPAGTRRDAFDGSAQRNQCLNRPCCRRGAQQNQPSSLKPRVLQLFWVYSSAFSTVSNRSSQTTLGRKLTGRMVTENKGHTPSLKPSVTRANVTFIKAPVGLRLRNACWDAVRGKRAEARHAHRRVAIKCAATRACLRCRVEKTVCLKSFLSRPAALDAH